MASNATTVLMTTTPAAPQEVALFECIELNRTGQQPDYGSIGAEIAGASCSLVMCIVFLLAVAVSRLVPGCQGLYHWLSLDHVISFAALTLLQSGSYFLSAPYGFASIYLPDGLCVAQALLRTFADLAVLLECFTIPFLAFLVIVRQTPFSVINATYRTRSFLFVYGGALAFAAVPAIIEFSTDIAVYSSQARTGTCNFSPSCLIVVIADFYWLLAVVTVAAVYLTCHLFVRVLQIYKAGTGATRVRQLDVTLFTWRRFVFGVFVVVFLCTEVGWISIAFSGVLDVVPHFNYFLRFVDQAIGFFGLLPFLPPKALVKCCVVRCGAGRPHKSFSRSLNTSRESLMADGVPDSVHTSASSRGRTTTRTLTSESDMSTTSETDIL